MTSIEWLIEQLEQKGDMRETPSIRNLQLNIDTSDYLELKRQAKEMHKQEVQNYGAKCCLMTKQKNKWTLEELYNETFVSKGSDEVELPKLNIILSQLLQQNVDKLGNEDVPKLGYDVEKLADEQYKDENIFSELKGLLVSAKKFGFIDGYNKAKSTLYTEEQVREAIDMARCRAEHIFWYNDDEIIQSLKQPKP